MNEIHELQQQQQQQQQLCGLAYHVNNIVKRKKISLLFQHFFVFAFHIKMPDTCNNQSRF